MAHFRDLFRLLALGLCLSPWFGCRAARHKNVELDTLAQSVSYDTSTAPLPHMKTVSYIPLKPAPPSDSDFEPEPPSIGKSIGEGMKAAGFLAIWGVIKVVEATLGSDDDDDDRKYGWTARGRADRDLDRWRADRDRWQKTK